MRVKLTDKAKRGRPGDEIDVDSKTAASYVSKGVAEYVNPEDADRKPETGARRGHILVQQIVDEDPYPGDVAQDADELVKDHSKDELAGLAKLSDSEAKSMTKQAIAQTIVKPPTSSQ